MTELIGWAALLVVGACGAFSITFVAIMALTRGGLEVIQGALATALVVALLWAAFVIWLSPITISMGVPQ